MGRSGRRSAVLLALALASFVAHEASADKVDILQVRLAREAPLTQLVVARASFGGDLESVTAKPAVAELLRFVYAQISSDCARIQSAELIGSGTAVLLDRGGPCSFAKKVKAVENAGSPLAIIGDTVAGAYASSRLSSQPIYDCSLGRGVADVNASSTEYPSVFDADDAGVLKCSASRRCVTNTCVYTGADAGQSGGFEVCCFANTLVRMGVDAGSLSIASQVAIPAVFVSYRDAQGLKHALQDNPAVSVRAVSVEESPWNVSMLLTWVLGVAVAVGGAYCSATEERRYSYEKVARRLVPPHSGGDAIETDYVSIDDRATSRGSAANEEGDSDRIQLSTRHAFYFVVGSSAILLLLYYGHFGLVVNVMFLVAATGALVQVATLPLVAHVLRLPTVEPSRREWIWYVVSTALALTLSLTWFVHRGSAWSWPLQDVLCVSLCFVVIDSIQMPSLRVATALLGLAFVYDIFFVYISPLVFGSSVMVDVASGNGLAQTPTTGRTHEKMPMVVTVPLLFSYYGGDALLGLGDIVLPGLLISFAIRYDYCMGYPISRQYFATASGSYAAGLLLANVAAVALRDVVPGQPALMYIVPLMLGAVTLRAAKQHELGELWDGPHCLRMQDPLVHGSRAAPRREEVEPFIKKMP